MTLSRLSSGVAPSAAVLSVVAYLGAAAYVLGTLGFPLDDAWIHLRLARGLAAGEGLSYGAGWVGASTAPLWTALLSLPFALPGASTSVGAIVWPLLCGVAAFLGLVAATAAHARALGLEPLWTAAAACFVASSHWLVWSSLSGMEITLFAALAMAGLAMHARERDQPARIGPPKAPALLALACLARPEGLVPLTLVLVDRWIGRPLDRRRAGEGDRRLDMRRELLAVATVFAILVPTVLVYWRLGGSPVPTTLAAKAGGGFGEVPSLALPRLVGGLILGSFPLLAPVALVGLWTMLRRGVGRPAALWLVGQPLAYAVLAGDGTPPMGNFGRYHFPLFPLVVLAAVVGLERLLRSARRPVVLAVLLVVAAPQAMFLAVGPARYVQTVANVQDSDVRAALWLRERLPQDAVLGVQDIGATGYLLPHRLVDLAGIVSADVRRALHDDASDRYWEERLVEVLETHRPDYLLVFAESYPALSGSPAFPTVRRFEVADNVTMAGSTLLVLRTPWTRVALRPTDDGA